MSRAIVWVLFTGIFGLNIKMSEKFSIEIWDHNYSSVYTMYYRINEDSLKIVFIGGIKEEEDKIVLCRPVIQEEKALISSFLSNFKIKDLKEEYTNPLVNDGDQKRIKIFFNGVEKTIDIGNVHQNDIEILFDNINSLLPEKFKIRYD